MARNPKIVFSIFEKDLGMSHIIKEAKKLAQKPFIKIGIQGDTALKPKKQRVSIEGKPVTVDSDMNIVDIATVHEYGTETIPERSFIRSTMDAKQAEFFSAAETLKNKIFQPSTKMTTETALGILGEKIQSAIQARFTDSGNGWAPLKSREGTPLVDTGQLRRSIRWKRFMS